MEKPFASVLIRIIEMIGTAAKGFSFQERNRDVQDGIRDVEERIRDVKDGIRDVRDRIKDTRDCSGQWSS